MSRPSKSAIKGFEYDGRWYKVLSLATLRLDENYQRAVSRSHLDTNIASFNPLGVRPLTVSLRSDGFYYIIDGQNRYEMMKADGRQYVVCEIHENLTMKQEADLFVLLNNMRTVNAQSKFRANYVAGVQSVIEIVRVVRQHGFDVNLSDKRARLKNGINSIASLQKIYQQYNLEVLSGTLFILQRSFEVSVSGHIQVDATGDFWLAGVSLFIFNNPEADYNVVAASLMGKEALQYRKYVEKETGLSRKDAAKSLAEYYLPKLLSSQAKTRKK